MESFFGRRQYLQGSILSGYLTSSKWKFYITVIQVGGSNTDKQLVVNSVGRGKGIALGTNDGDDIAER